MVYSHVFEDVCNDNDNIVWLHISLTILLINWDSNFQLLPLQIPLMWNQTKVLFVFLCNGRLNWILKKPKLMTVVKTCFFVLFSNRQKKWAMLLLLLCQAPRHNDCWLNSPHQSGLQEKEWSLLWGWQFNSVGLSAASGADSLHQHTTHPHRINATPVTYITLTIIDNSWRNWSDST